MPLDIYSSSIELTAVGVRLCLEISSAATTSHKAAAKREEKKTADPDLVPTAADLAHSFLDTQPTQERRALEEALAAERQDLAASVASSEDGSEDDAAFGTGQGLSLPVFLTDFLQGVADRTHVTVRDVAFYLDVEVPVGPKSSEMDLVSLRVSLDELHVEGLTTQTMEDDGSKIVPKEGKRHILLSGIRASLISRADVFSSLVRSPSAPSAASRSPAATEQNSSQPAEPSSTLGAEVLRSPGGGDERARSPRLLEDSEEALQIPYEMDGWGGVGDDDEREREPTSSLSTPRASIYHEFSGIVCGPTHLPTPEGPPSSDSWAPQIELDSDALSRSVSSDSASDDSGQQPSDDLTQSHYFSHEDVESMYMSAFSQTDSQRLRGEIMPGSWDSNPASPEGSPPNDSKNQHPATPRDASSASHDTSALETDDLTLPHGLEPPTPTLSVAREEHAPRPETSPSVPAEDTPKPSLEDLATQTDSQGTRGLAVKELLSLETISVYVPTGHQHIHGPTVDGIGHLAESTVHNVPGAFSVHSSAPQTPTPSKGHSQPAEKDVGDDVFEIHVAPVTFRFDASIGFILAMVVSRLVEASKGSYASSAERVGRPVSQPSAAPVCDVRLSVDSISVIFMDKIMGIAGAAARYREPIMDLGSEALLRAEFERLQATTFQSASSKETHVTLGNFRFGYHDSDILSFDRDAQLYLSMRDKFPDTGTDIDLEMTTSAENSRGRVNTLPLRVHIDLQRLDETLNWFGGLSGFLQMGASMTSSGPQKKPAAKPIKQRGVRFDVPAETDRTGTPGTKWDVRIGGLELSLVGKACDVLIRASAVKVSNRETSFRVHVSKIHASGPRVGGALGGPPVSITVTGTTMQYFNSPRDEDLDRLLRLIIPSDSNNQFNDEDDEIMVDPLLRQRRKGSVVTLALDDVQILASNLHQLDVVPALGDEIARLSAVTKYLPEDDRPGLLTLGVIYKMQASVDLGGRFGVLNARLTELELAHITFPSLAAVGVESIEINRNGIEELVGSFNDLALELPEQSPVLMLRMIGDQMEPVIRLMLRHLNIEYRVPTIMDVLGLSSETTPQEFDAMLAASVANLGEKAHHALVGSEPIMPVTPKAPAPEQMKPTAVNVAFRNCLLGLNPLGLTSKLSILLIDAGVEVSMPAGDDVDAVANLKKASILLIDDVSLLDAPQRPGPSRRRGSDAQRPTDVLSALCSKGYVNICQISSAKATVQVISDAEGDKHVDVELRDDLLVLETCADSTHTLIALAGALKPPTPPSKEVKFKTEVIPMQDMLASVTADAFGRAEGDYNFDDDFAVAQKLGGGDDASEGELVDVSPLEIRPQLRSNASEVSENIFDATSSSLFSTSTTRQAATDVEAELGMNSDIEVHENFFAMDPSAQARGQRWNSARNRYDEVQEEKMRKSPLKARVRDVHIIWNLFDGYDWQHTRDSITKTVEEVENQAFERQARSGRRSLEDPDFEDEDVVGDCLFNSIYVSIPANSDPRELVGGINHQIDDNESIAATTLTTATTRAGPGQFRSRAKKLRLGRSRRHKITFELAGVNVDLVQYPPGSGETDTSIDVRVNSLDVFDHVPTSTWRKFATYDLDAGERELDTSMVHLELLLVRPIPELAAVEHVLKLTVLPLRLHVDQDALDFIERFFQFKDESQAPARSSPSDEAFIQRAEVMDIPVVLDFKPKRVDYAGLRGGRTSEFMNFIILEGARLTLKHVILYGVPGFERMGNTLNDIWTPNVKEEQLAGVLAGVAPVRPLVNVGSGFRELIEVPIKEYKKDGRIVRSIGKGAAAFARTTGTEIVKLGAKLAVGTQYVLQGAEGMLTTSPAEHPSIQAGWEEEDVPEPEEKKQISLYADQPTGVIQGLRHAYSSLARDLNVARDAIIAVPAEVMESANAQGAAKAVLKRAPVIIFRPAIGATRAVGQALMGATNAMDPENLRRVEDVSLKKCQSSCTALVLTGHAEIQVRARKIRAGAGDLLRW